VRVGVGGALCRSLARSAPSPSRVVAAVSPTPPPRQKTIHRTRDDLDEDSDGPPTTTGAAAHHGCTGASLSPRHARQGSPRAAAAAAAAAAASRDRPPHPSPSSANGAQAHVQASCGPAAGRKGRAMGVLEFEADAAPGAAVFPPSDDDDDENEFGLAGGDLLRDDGWRRHAAGAERRRCCGLDCGWLPRWLPFSAAPDWPSDSRAGPSRRRGACCRLAAALAALAAAAALAALLLFAGGAGRRGARGGAGGYASSPWGASPAPPGEAPRLPRVRLGPPPPMALAGNPYCAWDPSSSSPSAPGLQLPGVVRPLRYSLHLSAQLRAPYAVQGVVRIAVEAAESTPCVVLHAGLDAAEAGRAAAGAAAFSRGGGGGGGGGPGGLPAPPALSRPWRAGRGEQGMRILSARLYFDGDALEEAAERRQQEQDDKGGGAGGDDDARGGAAAAAAWALPSPAVSWPAVPPPGFLPGEDYVDGALFNASADTGRATLFFPRPVRSYAPAERARAAEGGRALPTATLELSFNYTLAEGLDGFYRSSWTGASSWGLAFVCVVVSCRVVPFLFFLSLSFC